VAEKGVDEEPVIFVEGGGDYTASYTGDGRRWVRRETS
jgi:hypothetical protein